MPLWTAETSNPYWMSRRISLELGSSYETAPATVGVERNLLFRLPSASPATVTLNGPWFLLAWRALPGQPGATANVSVTIDGTLFRSVTGLSDNEYVVGPNQIRATPATGVAIPRFCLSRTSIVLSGQATLGGLLDTEFLAVALEW